MCALQVIPSVGRTCERPQITMSEAFREFVQDEGPALEQLRALVGGEAAKHLDGSADSLGVLDAFVVNLTASPDWEHSELYAEVRDIRKWLAVRIAYYMGVYARNSYGCDWHPSQLDDPAKGSPVLSVEGVEFSPLEVAWSLLAGDVEGGLVGFFADLEAERLTRRQRG